MSDLTDDELAGFTTGQEWFALDVEVRMAVEIQRRRAQDAAIASDREQLVSAMQLRARVVELRAEWVPHANRECVASAFIDDLDAVLGETGPATAQPDSGQVFKAVHEAVLHYHGEGFALAALIAERAVQSLGDKP